MSYIYLLVSALFACQPAVRSITFSTKTAYHAVENLNVTVTKPDGCREVQLNMVFRHGTRFPSDSDATDFGEMVAKLNEVIQHSTGLAPGVDLTFPETNPYRVADDKLLSGVGEKEMYDLATRFARRFPAVFKDKYSPNAYKFTSSCKSRSMMSGSSFGLGAFEKRGVLGSCQSQPVFLQSSPCHEDPILRFFDICTKYIDEVSENKTALIGLKEFLNGIEVKGVARKVNKRLGLGTEYAIKSEMMREMYVMCAFGIALHGKTSHSGWCSLFDEADFDVMEYALDLKSYLKRSSKYPVTYESSCPLLRDIVQSLKAKVDETNSVVNLTYASYGGVFRFAHAETMVPLYALMNMFIDKESLGPYNYNEMKNRKFRAARLSPLGGNVALVLYACGDGKHKIQMYVNEKLVQIPCCQSMVDCPFEQFDACYQGIVDRCNLTQICKVSHTSSGTSSSSIFSIQGFTAVVLGMLLLKYLSSNIL